VKSRSYRSYVVRVRRSTPAGSSSAAVKVDVEDLIDGGRAAIDGDEARTVADTLQSVVDNGRERLDDSPGPAPGAADPYSVTSKAVNIPKV